MAARHSDPVTLAPVHFLASVPLEIFHPAEVGLASSSGLPPGVGAATCRSRSRGAARFARWDSRPRTGRRCSSAGRDGERAGPRCRTRSRCRRNRRRPVEWVEL